MDRLLGRNNVRTNDFRLPGSIGKPITEDTAINLRRIIFGVCPAVVRPEFFNKGPGLIFRDADAPLAYALNIENTDIAPMTKAVLMAIQAHILQSHIFKNTSKNANSRDPLQLSQLAQKDALCSALTELIWKTGNKTSCTLCLPDKKGGHVKESGYFNIDGVTENLQLIEIDNRATLSQLINRYIFIFQENPGPGVLLLLYSIALTRGIEKIKEDVGPSSGSNNQMCLLHTSNFNINFSTLNLMLTGIASPFLHNGVEYGGGEDETTVENGVMVRSPIGLLVWNENEHETNSLRLGSRLKTPLNPIWLIVANNNVGVIFCPEAALLRDHATENRFSLHYITSTHYQDKPLSASINNRLSSKNNEDSISVLEKVIRIKWPEAQVDWKDTVPFI